MNILGRNILSFIVFCVLLILAVYGVLLPNNPQVSAVGSMQIAPYSDGLSLFQDYKRLYYRFSPFNDYTVDAQNNRSSFISVPEIESKQYETNLEKTQFENIAHTVKTYLTGGSPSVTFTTDKLNARYKALIEEDRVTVYQRTIFAQPQKIRRMGMTLSYNGDDIVFDKSLNAYSYWEQSDLDIFAQTYGVTLSPKTDRLVVPIPDRSVYITNPNASFVIVVRANPNQILRINRDAKLIEIEELTTEGSSHETSITVEILHNPEEAL